VGWTVGCIDGLAVGCELGKYRHINVLATPSEYLSVLHTQVDDPIAEVLNTVQLVHVAD
jgi:hypothetical protein